jgi:D-alanyl-D-alanine carboxypeptidase
MKTYDWRNTNKLLDTEKSYCIGVKTGYTSGAGSCLASAWNLEGIELVIIFMGGERTSSYDSRFEETPKLAIWAYEIIASMTSN